MGMFDQLFYKGIEYQTKDTPNQSLDNYKIEDGKLFVEEYDAEWVDEEDDMFGGYCRHSNERWVHCHKFDGNITFYRNLDKTYKVWETYSALFMDGILLRIKEKEL